jgi:type IV pilus assembly protein PilW
MNIRLHSLRDGVRRSTLRLHLQAGVTLVELMVALTVSLVLVLAAVVLFTTTGSAQRSLDEVSAAHESGAYALRAIGRDLANAGFYPVVRGEDPSNLSTPSAYFNPTAQASYNAGIFGCEGASFNVGTGVCSTTVTGPDSLVIAYFTSDSFGNEVGQRADCEGNDSANAPVNSTRKGSGPSSQPPLRPLFVANRYRVTAGQTTSVDGRTSNTRSLACSGNGDNDNTYTALAPGIEDLQLTYGVFSEESRLPAAFYRADQMAGLGSVTIDKRVMTPWERVVAVRVCVISRTFQSSTAIAASLSAPTYVDCNGAEQTNAAGDTSLRKTYIQVFGLRNRQSNSF